MRSLRSLAALSLLASPFALSACNDDDGGGGDRGVDENTGFDAGSDGPSNDAPVADAMVDGEIGDPLTPLDELAVGEWHEFVPGGNTTCSKGSPFKFYVYRGTSANVAVNFSGGGACWNFGTCNSEIFYDTVEEAETMYASAQAGNALPGLFDMTNEANPIQDYTHVFVPYCTADVHWGNAEITYEGMIEGQPAETTIQHRGAVNTQRVLDWLFANVKDPATVLTTGCSAGSYGAALWSAYLQHEYTDAHHVVFADSGAGVITTVFFENELTNWGIESAFPSWIADFDLDHVDSLGDVYTKLATESPNARFSQFNTIADGTQTLFYIAMGGDGSQWAPMMVASQVALDAAFENYDYYIAPGSTHCIIEKNDFYTHATDGVPLAGWLGDLLADEDVVDVTCEECSE